MKDPVATSDVFAKFHGKQTILGRFNEQMKNFKCDNRFVNVINCNIRSCRKNFAFFNAFLRCVDVLFSID